MIHTFKKSSYKLTAAAVLLIVALGAIFLNMASDDGKSAELDTTDQAASPNRQLSPVYDNTFSLFSSLDRALDFPKYDFKVPDYLPEGYQLENITYSINFSNADRTDLIDVASISFVANFGTDREQRIEMIASKGQGNLLEHNQLWGANYPYHNAKETPKYQQKAVMIGNTEGTLFTDKKTLKKKPETSKSFYWQDDSVWYAINYFNAHLSQEDLTKMIQSFVLPQQVQHIRYDGDGNSFVLYDEKDLLAAKNILGLKVRIPTKLSKLNLDYSILLKADDQNTGYGFRQVTDTDTLWTVYSPTRDSSMYGVSNYLSLYQSKEPLFDASKLSFTRKLEIDGVEISAYEDQKHIYVIPDKKRKWPIYLWKQDDIYYTAVFSGMDQEQEDNLKEIISAPLR